MIQRKPAGMPGFDPYWGGPPKNSTTGANDVANDPFWGPLGIRWISYCSTDHDSEGGIWLSVSTAADPKVLSSWRTYDQALAAGLFASVTTKPSKNPIFKHGAGFSIETPHVIKICVD
ncbi:hypothetical protein [Sphingomonas sp. BK069]|uniref:hypothetical protein n=1 Tax=Sphingomonas sp. BK069 TaxID=2586979 RepID=UPI00160DA474|nr:hypothetical protein [Sphingomonas sp. BK069]MBB3348812.1 hypothetical protein [Sphingomonas sp. BK069]